MDRFGDLKFEIYFIIFNRHWWIGGSPCWREDRPSCSLAGRSPWLRRWRRSAISPPPPPASSWPESQSCALPPSAGSPPPSPPHPCSAPCSPGTRSSILSTQSIHVTCIYIYTPVKPIQHELEINKPSCRGPRCGGRVTERGSPTSPSRRGRPCWVAWWFCGPGRRRSGRWPCSRCCRPRCPWSTPCGTEYRLRITLGASRLAPQTSRCRPPSPRAPSCTREWNRLQNYEMKSSSPQSNNSISSHAKCC